MEQKLKDYYEKNFLVHGEHENSLGWTKGKQFIRFYSLTKHFDLNQMELLDIGCGFADILKFFKVNDISLAKYTGIDLMAEFIQIAKKNWPENKYNFVVGNYAHLPEMPCDVVVASGIFGHKMGDSDQENYEYIESVFRKSLADARVGVSFDFISDKTDFKTSQTDFHASPAKVLDIAYKFSRNVILDNSAMPFEFCITIFKDDSFKKERTVFEKFLIDHKNKLTEGKL